MQFSLQQAYGKNVFIIVYVCIKITPAFVRKWYRCNVIAKEFKAVHEFNQYPFCKRNSKSHVQTECLSDQPTSAEWIWPPR